jgi:hypothetical protein
MMTDREFTALEELLAHHIGTVRRNEALRYMEWGETFKLKMKQALADSKVQAALEVIHAQRGGRPVTQSLAALVGDNKPDDLKVARHYARIFKGEQ